MDDGFSVAARAVAVAFRLQTYSEFRMVVNLAVENDPDCAILVGKGLMAATQINDGESPESQADLP